MKRFKRFKFETPAAITAGVSEKAKYDFRFYQFVYDCLYLHFSGNFGQVTAKNIESNNYGIKHKQRVFSNFVDVDHNYRILIITDHGHERTTILLPEEY